MNESEQQTSNQRIHVKALALTKLGDGLLDPKLVLSWLLSSLEAGAGTIGWLVPIREAGALLPQLFTASRLRQVAVRKWWWVVGSIVQGVAILGIVFAGLFTRGLLAGLLILSFLTVFALARSIASVSYKDVLGKTVEKSKRGVVSGTAAAIAAAGVLVFGLLLVFGVVDRTTLVFGALFLASGLWLAAAYIFSQLAEAPSEVSVTPEVSVFKTYWQYLRTDLELQKFLVVRGLLTATAVAPPFLILLASDSTQVINQLGVLVLASSFATFISGRIWGIWSDHSTRVVLGSAGLLGGLLLIIGTVAAGSGFYTTVWFLPVIISLFLVMYQGVRIGRTIHLVNIATEETRAAYTALSNTIIGIVLLATGFLGVLGELTSIQTVLYILAGMSLLGGYLAFRLE